MEKYRHCGPAATGEQDGRAGEEKPETRGARVTLQPKPDQGVPARLKASRQEEEAVEARE